MMDMDLTDIREIAGFGKAVVVNIRGRVVGCRIDRGQRYTRVLSPAVDVYAHPQVFEIRSRGHLANQDQDVSCHCSLQGTVLTMDEINEGVRPIEITLTLCETFNESEV